MGSGPSAEAWFLRLQTNGDVIWLTNKQPERVNVVCYRYKGGQVTAKMGDEWVDGRKTLAKPECRLDVIEDAANRDGKIQYKFMIWPEDRQASDGYRPEIITMEYKQGHTYWKHKAPHIFREAWHGKGEWEDPCRELMHDSPTKCVNVFLDGREIRAERFAAAAAEHMQEYVNSTVKGKAGNVGAKLATWYLGQSTGDMAFETLLQSMTQECMCDVCKTPWLAPAPFISTKLCPDCRPP